MSIFEKNKSIKKRYIVAALTLSFSFILIHIIRIKHLLLPSSEDGRILKAVNSYTILAKG